MLTTGQAQELQEFPVDSQDLKDDQACFQGESLGLELETKTSTEYGHLLHVEQFEYII